MKYQHNVRKADSGQEEDLIKIIGDQPHVGDCVALTLRSGAVVTGNLMAVVAPGKTPPYVGKHRWPQVPVDVESYVVLGNSRKLRGYYWSCECKIIHIGAKRVQELTYEPPPPKPIKPKLCGDWLIIKLIDHVANNCPHSWWDVYRRHAEVSGTTYEIRLKAEDEDLYVDSVWLNHERIADFDLCYELAKRVPQCDEKLQKQYKYLKQKMR